MDAHDEFLAFIENLESLRKDKKLTPDVCARQEGSSNATTEDRTDCATITEVKTEALTTPTEATEANTTATTATDSSGSTVHRNTARGPLGLF